jgi:predicted Rossmann fold nucleotide-binding protein DprA/Smf involved in DNA uptake
MTTVARADDEAACATALASLGASPARLRRMLADHTPGEAWAAIAGGCHPADPDGAFRPKASAELLERARASCHESSITVQVVGSAQYPAALIGDREAPAVVFTRGDLAALVGRPRVAIVGTRSATPSRVASPPSWGRPLLMRAS